MDMFRRKKSDDDEDDDYDEEEDELEEDFDLEEMEAMDDADDADDASVPATPETEAESADVQESGTPPSAEPEAVPDENSADNEGENEGDGDEPEFDDDDFEDDDGDDESAGGGKFAALKEKLGASKKLRYGVYGGLALFLLSLIGGTVLLFMGGGEEHADATEQTGTSGAGGLQPPSNSGGSEGGGLNELSEVEGESINSEKAAAGIEAFSAAGGLNAAAAGGGADTATGALMMQVASLSAYSRYPDREAGEPLSKAPNSELLEFRGGAILPLPRIADDGRVSWQEYARPNSIGRGVPKVAIIITGMGLSKAGTLASIRKLPPEVTLSFSPYADELGQWMVRSRRAGHEVMLGLPLESNRFPIEDHGPLAMMADLPTEDNIILLEDILVLLQGSIGVEVIMGSRFTSNTAAVRDLLNMLNSSGLMIAESKENPGSKIPALADELQSPCVVSDIRLDTVMASSAINARLKDAERIIKKGKPVIIKTSMTPAIMERLQIWFASLRTMGVVIVPVSSLIKLSTAEES